MFENSRLYFEKERLSNHCTKHFRQLHKHYKFIVMNSISHCLPHFIAFHFAILIWIHRRFISFEFDFFLWIIFRSNIYKKILNIFKKKHCFDIYKLNFNSNTLLYTDFYVTALLTKCERENKYFKKHSLFSPFLWSHFKHI